jgi:hypothetical protein
VTVRDIELALSRHFEYRTNIIIPNVSWGFLYGREADLLILSKSGWLTEVEIKVSAADIKRDLQKRQGHWDRKVRQCWFAVPAGLASSPDIPEHYGVLAIGPKIYAMGTHEYFYVESKRVPKINPEARKVDDKDRMKLMRLGCMRIWSLKEALSKSQKRKLELSL